MKKKLLALTIIGTALPNYFVIKEGLESGNYMLYTRPLETIQTMFANNISSTFVTDLLFIVVLFMIWSFAEAKRRKIKGLWLIWIYTFILGLAGGLPLFLYKRQQSLEKEAKP